MEQVSRVWFTPQQKAELWERWKSGQCIAAIARTLGRRNKSGVYRVLALNGGIMPTPRRRAPLALRLDEREEISRELAAGQPLRQIASRLGRAPSTVSREIGRNGGAKAIGPDGRTSGPGIVPCVPNLSPGAAGAVTMARGPETGAAMVAGADRRLAEAAVPNRASPWFVTSISSCMPP